MTDAPDTPANRKKREPREPFALEETLREWEDAVRDVLIDLIAMEADIAQRVAREVVLRFAEDHPGEAIYVPKALLFRLDVRDQGIYDKFNGRNYNELAREFGVTPRHVRRVIKRAKAIDTATRIDDMFPGREIPDRH
jgi:Mor family transcriptional regulator